jgi:hypothetical protein
MNKIMRNKKTEGERKEAMGRKIVRIPFGGMGSARDLRG